MKKRFFLEKARAWFGALWSLGKGIFVGVGTYLVLERVFPLEGKKISLWVWIASIVAASVWFCGEFKRLFPVNHLSSSL